MSYLDKLEEVKNETNDDFMNLSLSLKVIDCIVNNTDKITVLGALKVLDDSKKLLLHHTVPKV